MTEVSLSVSCRLIFSPRPITLEVHKQVHDESSAFCQCLAEALTALNASSVSSVTVELQHDIRHHTNVHNSERKRHEVDVSTASL